jgi:hypothetical protein
MLRSRCRLARTPELGCDHAELLPERSDLRRRACEILRSDLKANARTCLRFGEPGRFSGSAQGDASSGAGESGTPGQ